MAQSCSAGTREYQVDIGKLALRRLMAIDPGDAEILQQLETGKDHIQFSIEQAGDLERWCRVLQGMLLWDLAHFELARMVNDLPLGLEEKRRILPEAVKLSRACPQNAGADAILRELMGFYAEEKHLNLEGFMRFRMQDVLREWEICVMRAAEELLLHEEYWELMHVLSAFVQLRSPQVRDVYIVLNPDGSCTMTDDQDSRIDYARCTGDGVMSVLVGLAPERITVYDLSGGLAQDLADTLKRVFEDRVRIYT